MIKITDIVRRFRLSGVRMPFNLDIYTLAGAGAALLVILAFYLFRDPPEGEKTSTLVSIIGLLIALSPLLVAYRVERTTGHKIFSGYQDFFVAVTWFPLTVLVMLMTENKAIIAIVMTCGFLVDPVLFGSRRAAYPGKTRLMMAYARGLCGIIGTILALTFIAKLMDIGNPKNKKSLVQEILSVVMWGYIGKTFFDFIGVTKPIALGSLFPGARRP